MALKAEYTPKQARARALLRWDESECTRIGRWNLLVAVYIARHGLVQRIAAHPRSPTNTNHIRKVEVIGDLNELVQIRTGRGMLAQHRIMANNVETLAAGRDGGLYTLAKGT